MSRTKRIRSNRDLRLSVATVADESAARYAISGYRGGDPAALPLPIGYEVSGVIDAIDPDTRIEAVDVSLALVAPDRLVTIAAPQRAEDEGFHAVAGAMPESAAFRDSVRGDILAMAADGALVVPMA